MPRHPGNQNSLFVWTDLLSRPLCPECGRLAKVVVPATTVTYLVHGRDDICVVDWQTLFEFGPKAGEDG